MGDRYYLTVKCSKCGRTEKDVWYAPTCNVIDYKCPCGNVIDLEEYSGIEAETCANTEAGYNSVVELKKERAGKKGK